MCVTTTLPAGRCAPNSARMMLSIDIFLKEPEKKIIKDEDEIMLSI